MVICAQPLTSLVRLRVQATPLAPVEPATIAVRRCDPVMPTVVVGPPKTNLLKGLL